jgi:thymidylate kinase
MLIVFEGLDGSGKSTAAEFVAKELDYKLVSAPSNTSNAGKLARELLSSNYKDYSKESVSLIISLLSVIDRSHLPTHNTVYSRYALSSLAYVKIPDSTIEEYFKRILDESVEPDLVFFINTPPDICYNRIQNRARALELYETLDHLNYVYKRYTEKAIPYFISLGWNIVTIDGTLSVDKVRETCLEHIERCIYPRRYP